MTIPKRDKNKYFAELMKQQTQDRLEEFRQYTLEIEAKFDSDKSLLFDNHEEALKGLSEAEAAEINEYFYDDLYMVEDIHVGTYRKSTIVSLYSYLESSMNLLCRHLSLRDEYPVKIEDLTGAGIVRAKSYLEKLTKIDFSVMNGEWSHLSNLNRVRNCIVHSEGDIRASKGTSKLRTIVTEDPNLSLKFEALIKVEREYIDSSITHIETFLQKLHEQAFTMP